MLRFFNCFFNKKFQFFFGNSRVEHSVPKKTEKRHNYRCYCGSYLWKIKFSGKILPNQADSETGC